jgi:hypothetical protein
MSHVLDLLAERQRLYKDFLAEMFPGGVPITVSPEQLNEMFKQFVTEYLNRNWDEIVNTTNRQFLAGESEWGICCTGNDGFYCTQDRSDPHLVRAS